MKCSASACGLLAAASSSLVPVAVATPVHGGLPGSVTYNMFRRHGGVDRPTQGNGTYVEEFVSARGSRGDWYINSTIAGQPIDLMIDTGSATFWTLGPQAANANPGAAFYDPTKSTNSSKKQAYSFAGTYLGGQVVQGDVYNDDVCLGDENDCVEGMSFGVATTAARVGDMRSGVVGLAFNDTNTVKPVQQPTFMDYLMPRLAEPVFTLKLGSTKQEGQIAFGRVDANSYTGHLQQIQVDTHFSDEILGQWVHPNATFSKDNQTLGSQAVGFDTGTVETVVPEAVMQAYFSGVEGAQKTSDPSGMWSVGCNTSLPDLTLTMDAATMVIPGEKLIFAPIASDPSVCYVSLISSGNSSMGFVGAAAFEEYFMVFNYSNRTISWAKQAQGSIKH